jgi:hypothetical protein
LTGTCLDYPLRPAPELHPANYQGNSMLRLTLFTLALAAGLLTTGALAMAQAIDTAAIETATGLKGATTRRKTSSRSASHATT